MSPQTNETDLFLGLHYLMLEEMHFRKKSENYIGEKQSLDFSFLINLINITHFVQGVTFHNFLNFRMEYMEREFTFQKI